MSCENQRALWQQRDQELTQATADRAAAADALVAAQANYDTSVKDVQDSASAAAAAYQAYLDCLTSTETPTSIRSAFG